MADHITYNIAIAIDTLYELEPSDEAGVPDRARSASVAIHKFHDANPKIITHLYH